MKQILSLALAIVLSVSTQVYGFNLAVHLPEMENSMLRMNVKCEQCASNAAIRYLGVEKNQITCDNLEYYVLSAQNCLQDVEKCSGSIQEREKLFYQWLLHGSFEYSPIKLIEELNCPITFNRDIIGAEILCVDNFANNFGHLLYEMLYEEDSCTTMVAVVDYVQKVRKICDDSLLTEGFHSGFKYFEQEINNCPYELNLLRNEVHSLKGIEYYDTISHPEQMTSAAISNKQETLIYLSAWALPIILLRFY